MAKRTHQSVEPAPPIEAHIEPALEAMLDDRPASENITIDTAPADVAVLEIAAPASARGVSTLSAADCRAELDRLGDPVASRKERRRDLEKMITARAATLKELDAAIAAADRAYRAVLDQSQADAERVRQIVSVRLPQLEAAAAAESASRNAAMAQAESTLEREALL
jgi:hypothetical protein